MNRTAGILIGFSLLSFTNAQAQKNTQRPNIILINIDDLGWADVQYNGSKYYETPNINALHAKGISFLYAYAGAANSSPSRACLLSGMNTPRHGVYTVDPPDRGKPEDRKLIPCPNKSVLDLNIVTLPQTMKNAGYRTCHIGKWHIGFNPLQQGMDTNIGGNHAGNPSSYFSPYHNPNLKDGPKGEYLMDRLAYEAVNYLDTVRKDKPFFLYYATYAVHTPLQAKTELIEKYKNKPHTEAHFNPVYAAMVENMDACVGRVLEAVEHNGLSENTLIVFTGDNGGVYDISHQWPLRAGKGSFYEGGIREPFIVYMKGRYEGGKEIKMPISQLDLYPTFMELAGEKSDTQLDGLSLLPLLDHHKTGYLRNRPLYFHFPAYLEGGNKETRDMKFRTRPVSVIIDKGWKLIENYEDESLELYNLNVDPSENNNIAGKKSRKAQQLLNKLDAWKSSVHAPIPQPK